MKNLIRFFALLLCFFYSFLSFAQTSEAEIKIGTVSFEVPESGYDEAFLENIDEIRNRLEIKTGDEFSPEVIQDLIKFLYKWGLFSQIKVYGKQDDKRMNLRVLVEPKTKLETIRFIGNSHLSDFDLKYVIELREGDNVIDDDLINEMRSIQNAYRRKGYVNSTIGGRLIQDYSPYLAIAEFRINEGEPIDIQSIDFIGHTHFKKSFLLGKLGVDIGDRLDLDKLIDGVKKLKEEYYKADFHEAKIELLESDENSWSNSSLYSEGRVKIKINSGQKIKLIFSGNMHYSPNELQAALKMEERSIISYTRGTLEKFRIDLADFYKRQGYYNAKVEVKTRTRGLYFKDIIFVIFEGKRAKLTQVNFGGNEAFDDSELEDELLANVRATLDDGDDNLFKPVKDTYNQRYRFEERAREYPARELAPYARPEDLGTDEVYIEEVFSDAALAVEDFYRENGFLSCKIGEPQPTFSSTGQRVEVLFDVFEGTKTLIRSVRYVGINEKPLDEIMEITEFKVGDPLNDLAFGKINKQIRKYYATDGYLYTQVDISYTLSPNHEFAEILVALREGPQVKIGDILVSGIKKTDLVTVKRELTFESGDIYRPAGMDESKRWLQKLGIFQAMTIKPFNPEKEEEVKDIVVDVKERLPGRFELSAGLATDDGVRGGVLFVYRNIMGHALEFHLKAKMNHRIPLLLDEQFADIYSDMPFEDRLERDIIFGFYHPSFIGTHIGARFDLIHSRVQERSFGLTKNSFAIGFDTEIFRYLTLTQLNELAYLDVTPTFLQSLKKGYKPPREGTSLEVSPKLQAVFDYRDSVFTPTRGVVLSGLTEYFDTLTGDADVDLVRLTGSIAGYVPIPLTKKPIVFKLALKSGFIFNIANEKIPLEKRFKLGGRTSLRGFGEDAVYSSDLNDAEIADLIANETPSQGGECFFLIKADLRIPVYKSYYVGAFYDAGNMWIFPENFNLSLQNYKMSSGGGIHYRTPVGDISLEIGWNLKPNYTFMEDDWRIHFSISLF